MRRIILGTLAATVLAAQALTAQSSTGRVAAADEGLSYAAASVRSIIILVPGHWRYGTAEAVITRAPNRDDVIALRSAYPKAEVVNAAIGQLRILRGLHGETAARPATYRVLANMPLHEDGGFSRVIADNLNSAPPGYVYGERGISMRVTPNRAQVAVQRPNARNGQKAIVAIRH